MSRLDQLDSIPEGVVDVATAHVGNLIIETHVVTSGPECSTQSVESFDHQCGVGLAGGPEFVLDPEVQSHPAVGEPTPTSGREHGGLLTLLEPQDALVEVPSLELTAPGHRQLDVVDGDKLIPHDPTSPRASALSGREATWRLSSKGR
jgi:hypothetical protein